MKKATFILISIAAILLVHSCEKEMVDLNVEAEILAAMEEQNIPSVAAAIIKGDEIVWEGYFGHANVEHDVPATSQTIYSLQSITKLVLATSVMQLWERGQLDLDADINQYLPFEVRNPNYPDHPITAYHLLTHCSGLAWPVLEDNIPDFDHFYLYNEEPPTPIEWLPAYILPGGEHYRNTVWKDFAPGEKWLYSNIGTTLLALVVEEVAEMDFRDYIQMHILEPLEMDQSAFRLTEIDPYQLVTPYTNDNLPMHYFVSRHYPAGFLSTNVDEFTHFMRAILDGGVYEGERILESSTIDKMLSLQSPASGVGHLWWHFLGNTVGHEGGGTGFRSFAEWNLENDWSLIIFSNINNPDIGPGGRIYELVRYMVPE